LCGGHSVTLLRLNGPWPSAQLAQLRAWVNGVLIAQYPEYTVPACWEGHLPAWWELGNLAAEWTSVYGDPRGADLEAAMWFHERWLPGTIGWVCCGYFLLYRQPKRPVPNTEPASDLRWS
jgi:hypothetical protein